MSIHYVTEGKLATNEKEDVVDYFRECTDIHFDTVKKITNNLMCEKATNTPNIHSVYQLCIVAPQLSISQKALGTLPEDSNVMTKHVGATIHN
jgi:hypothetical protein